VGRGQTYKALPRWAQIAAPVSALVVGLGMSGAGAVGFDRDGDGVGCE
jgi:hypothetical protein